MFILSYKNRSTGETLDLPCSGGDNLEAVEEYATDDLTMFNVTMSYGWNLPDCEFVGAVEVQ